MTNHRRNHFARAFTLPEVLVVIVLMGIALPAVMRGISLSLAAADDARKRVQAVALAETKLSELSSSSNSIQTANSSGDFGAEFPEYQWQSSSRELATDLSEIQVRVTWAGRGLQRHVDLVTCSYIAATAGTVITPASGATPQSTGGAQ